MSSTILYKFRSGQTFESLALPGSAARLLDVKKAIVRAKKLDRGQLEFDLSVRDASTDQEYVDEGMVLPRGTRVVVQRLPAARGHGFLARMARADAGASSAGVPSSTTTAPSGFYTIDSRANEEEEEFVSTNGGDEEKELAALMAVTDPGMASTNTVTTMGGGFRPMATATTTMNRPAGSGPPPPRPMSHFPSSAAALSSHKHSRPNADPELRDQQQPMLKKRATGIPRTFLNLSAPPVTTDGGGGEFVETAAACSARLQPNAIGFEELVNRGGGQSERTAGTKRDLEYALKLTSTEIPEHLQCGICHGVVKNAMLLPWDMEGRTACETCIRDALTQSGFRCPLTGMEGVSPDDLHPNHGLRKAAELFIKGVMEKMDEIDKQQVDELDVEENEIGVAATLEGDSGDKGVIVSRRTMKDHKRKNDDDPFGGGDDDFGGDVFDVAPDHAEEEDADEAKGGDEKPSNDQEPAQDTAVDSAEAAKEDGQVEKAPAEKNGANKESKDTEEHFKVNRPNQSDKSGDVPSQDHSPAASKARDGSTVSPHGVEESRRARRGPPAGYAMGPAGGAAVRGARKSPELDNSSPTGRGGSSPYGGGRGGRGEFFGRVGRGGRVGRFGGRFEDDFARGRGRGGRGGGYQQPRFDPQEVSRSRRSFAICILLVRL